MAQKIYVNGRIMQSGETTVAKAIIKEMGIYRTLGNFGPYLDYKLKYDVVIVDTFVRGGFQFTIVESEVMALCLGSMSVSEPYMQRECWFQPCL